jgi:rubrerythrin
MFNEFLKDLEIDLRRESNQTFLFEEINVDYKNQMIQIFNKAIKDELEAMLFYRFMSEKFYENEIDEKLKDISNEEHQHFTEIVAYASNHGILKDIDFSVNILHNFNNVNTLKELLDIVLLLEQQAFSDYKKASEIAEAQGDIESKIFFEELMKDEMHHYDALSKYSGITRGFNEI